MKYLREGYVCVEAPDHGGRLVDITTGAEWSLDASQQIAARTLITGLGGEGGDSVSSLSSTEPGLIEDREEPFDRILCDRLAGLDAGFSWMAPSPRYGLLHLCELAHSLLRHARQDLDQLPVLPETSARRAVLLRTLCGPGASVACVGDDDLVSIAAAACGLKPTVLDVDPDLLRTIGLLADRLGLDIDVREVDLQKPLPPDLTGVFDAFCTDPENSRECVCLFLSRGASLVRTGGIGLMASAEEWEHLVAEALDETGIERLCLHRRFNNYRDWSFSLSPYRSDLHVVTVAEHSQPLVAADSPFEGALFPFGLAAGGEHLVATVTRCDREALEGEALVDLVSAILGAPESAPAIDDLRPFPVRVVRGSSEKVTVQATVGASGASVDLDIAPAPSEESEIHRIQKLIATILETSSAQLRLLSRVE